MPTTRPHRRQRLDPEALRMMLAVVLREKPGRTARELSALFKRRLDIRVPPAVLEAVLKAHPEAFRPGPGEQPVWHLASYRRPSRRTTVKVSLREAVE